MMVPRTVAEGEPSLPEWLLWVKLETFPTLPRMSTPEGEADEIGPNADMSWLLAPVLAAVEREAGKC